MTFENNEAAPIITSLKKESLLQLGITEKMIQERIANDPSILGLGTELYLIDKERSQPHAGRLDLLMVSDEDQRYEIEIQLGKTDEKHIIRTIEYWDIERQRYPMYEHYAVIVAEDITSRFLNVIRLFNGAIPLYAIQMSAYKYGDGIGIAFTKILDPVERLPEDVEDEKIQTATDRNDWIRRASETTVKMADAILDMLNDIKPGYNLNYLKHYIGLKKNEQPDNFVQFRPRKDVMSFSPRLQSSPEIDEILDEAEIGWCYYRRDRRYDIKLRQGSLEKHAGILKNLLRKAGGFEM